MVDDNIEEEYDDSAVIAQLAVDESAKAPVSKICI